MRPRPRPWRLAALLGTLCAASWLGLSGAFVAAGIRPGGIPGAKGRVILRARGGQSPKVAGDLEPLSNHLLLKLGKPELVTKSGLVLPGKRKAQSGTVVAVGPGERDSDGKLTPVSVATGLTAVYSKGAYFDTFDLEDVEHAILPENEILAAYSGEEPTLEGITMPRGRVLVEMLEATRETTGGLLLSKGAVQEEVNMGKVLAAGEPESDSSVELAKGDLVRFRYGDEVELNLGDKKAKYRSVSASECIAKMKGA